MEIGTESSIVSFRAVPVKKVNQNVKIFYALRHPLKDHPILQKLKEQMLERKKVKITV